ncbi:hypothetical protein SZ64_12200 [Erythrobacter sp. SG61-1L]|uniref:hypothetical protein n=1 Tax=Erythrobacter sp. SG61-1L TaxID=1603897 RepID=UPI0006C9229A|nr:hypothetical protein [Erythrobacter sp. SG61-1L]KPL68787.1 hypothetical protein SZ64_12200 [Erythrobacter sp. SG61-1L]
MNIFSSRKARIVAALPLLMLLTAARASVTQLPETIIPADSGIALNTPTIVREGDVVLRAKVYDTEVVTLDVPVSVSIAKFSQDIDAGTRLDPVLVPEKTTRLTGADGRIYCGEDQRTRSKFMAAMLGDWFSKYEAVVRFCFVDTDDDKKLDHVFLAGAKDKEDLASVEIPPTPYTLRMFQKDDDAGVLELRVDKIKPGKDGDKIRFKLFMTKNGAAYPFDYIVTVTDGKREQTYPQFESNPRKVPYPAYFNDILGASVGITRVDAAEGEAEINVYRRFKTQLFKPVSITITYVYIYY